MTNIFYILSCELCIFLTINRMDKQNTFKLKTTTIDFTPSDLHSNTHVKKAHFAQDVLYSKSGNIYSKTGNIHSKTGNIHSKTSNIHSKTGNIHYIEVLFFVCWCKSKGFYAYSDLF